MDDKIGPALREARIGKGLSLRSVATATGISASLLSQVETGKSQPSVSTLYSLVNFLGVSLDELLGIDVPRNPPSGGVSTVDSEVRGGRPSPVQRAADNPVLDMDNGVRWERLAGGDHDLVDPLLVTYAPGASSSVEGRLMRHSGVEYAYLLSGELTLQLEFDRYVVHAGDSFCFDSTRPHLYHNHTGKPARGLWYVVGRHTLDHTRDQVAALLNRPEPAGSARRPANVVEALELLDQVRQANQGDR
ncbi:cupin domain-containing protein [Amycolatopsis thermophila]|uniref:Transcriptional regulator with XRE-family HTH domain n=1 Tax=Amycolatopsis thermophila TaxID=206084 RepID=A0ABU0F1L6_9PSEU|nr:cupin domain-containing protein [Amycolatopsis thermophila]MDQ0381278.1 transcriptional regulator with XRE-family HTH domain [Amycolatopsis thermophila]